jgi:4-hydroxy-tetrahydrodipicolinate synthase
VAHGVGGVLMLPPFYYKQISDDGIFATFEYIIQQISDEHLKVYLYHFPKMTGVPFSNAVVERLIRTYPDTVVGMKDSSGDWEHMKFLCENFPGFHVYAGTEKFLLDILLIGGAGCISASTNVTCKIAGEVFTAWKHHEHEAAKKLQKRLTELRMTIEQYSFVSGLKHIMANFTRQEDWLNMRPPNVPLKNKETQDLEENLESLNFTKHSFALSARSPTK